MTLYLTLNMTTIQVVETLKTNNSLSKDSHPDDHTKQITDTPGLKPFTMLQGVLINLYLLCFHAAHNQRVTRSFLAK